MSPELISILVLGLIFVVATLLPVNIGVLAFTAAFLVGTLVADQSTDDIIAGFPSDLFLTLVGITFLFAVAQNNGTVDWLVELAVRAVRGRIGAIPWIMFALAAVLTAVGAVSPGAVAIIAPIALGFAVQYQISPLLMGLMVIHGAQAGGFSPISIYGGITNGVVEEAGLPLNEVATFLASLFVNLAVAVLLFVFLGGRDLLRRRAEVAEGPAGDTPEPSAAGGAGDGRPAPGAGPRVLATSPSWPRRRMVTPRWRPAPRSGSSSGRRGPRPRRLPTSGHRPRGPTSSSPSPGSSPWPR
jgi:Na+/H+ antiporter NhaC